MLLFLPSAFLFFTLRCFGRLLLLLSLAASICVLCTAMLRLWLLTALLLRRTHAGKTKYFSPSPLLLLSFESILLLLLLLRRDMHFRFLVEVPLLLIIFLAGCAAAGGAAGVLLTASVLKQREVPATVSSFYVSVLYTCLLYTSPSPRDQRGSRMPSSA